MASARADERRHQSTLIRNERKLDRELLVFFAALFLAMKESFNDVGIAGARAEIQKAQPALKDILQGSYMRSGPEGMRLAAEQLEEEDFTTEAVLLALLVWADVEAQVVASQITSTTANIFDDLIADNTANVDVPLKDTLNELKKRNRNRTGTISTTEIGKGVNRGSFEAAEEIQRGLIFEIRKSWTSQKDLSVRPSHARANRRYTREPIPVNEVFQVGASFGRFPHDSTLSSAESIGCRCFIRYRKVKVSK